MIFVSFSYFNHGCIHAWTKWIRHEFSKFYIVESKRPKEYVLLYSYKKLYQTKPLSHFLKSANNPPLVATRFSNLLTVPPVRAMGVLKKRNIHCTTIETKISHRRSSFLRLRPSSSEQLMKLLFSTSEENRRRMSSMKLASSGLRKT